MITVFATAGGRRYHAVRDCRALELAQLLSDWDCPDDCYLLGHRHLSARPVLELSLADAVVRREPCRVCKPELPVAPSYGHVPVVSFTDGRGVGRVCARCTNLTSTGIWGVRWPCATVRVLGVSPKTL
jgi:hypothetical protein